MAREGTEEELARADAMGRRLGVGCFTLVTGFVSGAMIAVLIGKFLAFLAREQSCEGVPMCDWYIWFWTGGALVALDLVADLLEPLRQRALGDRLAHLGHHNVYTRHAITLER